jgi:beta-glucosidase
MAGEPFRDPRLPIAARVADLLGRMSVTEKVGQLNQRMFGWHAYTSTPDGYALTDAFFAEVTRWGGMGALYGLQRADAWSGRDLDTGVPAARGAALADAVQRWVREHTRWGIPVLLVEEVPHGHQAIDGTVLPVNLAVGATWDPAGLRQAASLVAAEVRARGAHVALVSGLDIVVDPRWGRAEECFGEDPYLAAALVDAVVRGMQGEPSHGYLPAGKVAVVLKHFAGQGAAAGGRNAYPTPIGPRELREIHLPAAAAGVRAGAAGVMAAYTTIDGVPCAGNRELLTGILREQWGFTGVVMADGHAIDRMAIMTGDLRGAAALALTAGVDLSLWDTAFTHLESALAGGLVSQRALDRAVARVLRLKFRLGLFDRPAAGTVRDGGQAASARAASVRLARRSLVLLKNHDRLLPLSRTARIAVIGPNADDLASQLGDYTAPQRPGTGVSVLAGMGGAGAGYERGCGLTTPEPGGLDRARKLAGESDVAILVLGGSSDRTPGAAMTAGEEVDLADMTLPATQRELVRAVAGTGTPVVAVLIQGRPHALAEVGELCQAVLCAWYPGPGGGTAIATVLFGDRAPGGRLPVSIPRSSGVLPVAYHAPRSLHGGYLDAPDPAEYRFGFGLGYASVACEAVALSAAELTVAALRAGAAVEVRVWLRNPDPIEADEVVQVYTRRMAASVWPRERMLKGFQRVSLAPGGRAEVVIRLGRDELGAWLPGLRFDVEPGRQLVMVAGGTWTAPARHLTIRP